MLHVIKPRKGLASLDLKELIQYKDLLFFLAWRNIKVRYKQTVIGALWAVLQPVTTMIVFSIFFGALIKVPSEGIPYPIFVYAGLLPWTFFANVVRFSATSVIEDEKLITKVYFPRLIIPSSVVGVELIDFFVAFIIFVLMMIYYGVSFSATLLAIPLLLLLMIFSALGVGLILSALSVAYRDFRYVVPFLIQLWMYISPVVYPVSLVPEKWHWLLALNPMTGIIDGFRSAFLHTPFNLSTLAISATVSIALLIGGTLYFKQLERRFADLI